MADSKKPSLDINLGGGSKPFSSKSKKPKCYLVVVGDFSEKLIMEIMADAPFDCDIMHFTSPRNGLTYLGLNLPPVPLPTASSTDYTSITIPPGKEKKSAGNICQICWLSFGSKAGLAGHSKRHRNELAPVHGILDVEGDDITGDVFTQKSSGSGTQTTLRKRLRSSVQLLADDSQDTKEEKLKKQKIVADTADALDAIAEGKHPDVALIHGDYALQLLKLFKEQSIGVPVIVAAPNLTPEFEKMCLDEGAQKVMNLPVSIQAAQGTSSDHA